MKKSLLALLLGVLTIYTYAQSAEIYFTSSPSLSPDGKMVLFSYESDLWKVNATGGSATRLTAMQGDETRAKYSPDGKWIAFTGSQNGNQDVYVMPADGGAIRQLTYHEGYDHVDSWSWDSKNIYFTSSRYSRFSGYSVSAEGGTATRLFDNYFHTVHNLVESPNGELFFSESWESKNQAHRKRYKGSFNPDVQSYNSKTGEYKKYTDYIGKDFWVTIDQKGKIFFASDEANGEYNLYTLENGKKTALTSFTTSIKDPFVSANGEKIVFEKDFQIYVYDVAAKASQKLNIQTVNNFNLEKEKDFSVSGKIEYFDVSADNKKFAFVSRGELFASDVEGKFVTQIKTNSPGRVTEVKWFADNKTLLYTQTNVSGFTNLFTVSAEGKSVPKQITNESQNNRDLNLNKARTKATYLSGRSEVRLLDLTTLESQLIAKDEIWGYQNSAPRISPNDEYVMFTAHRNFEQDIFLYNLNTKKLTNFTQTAISENVPCWSPDGKYIYFASNRYKPAYPFGTEDTRIYRIPLEKTDSEFRSDRYAQLFQENSKEEPKQDEKSKGKKETPPEKTEPKPLPYSIDFNHVMNRMELVSPNFGVQYDPMVLQKDEKTWVIYTSNHDENKGSLWVTTYEPFKKPKTEKIEGTDNAGTDIVKAGDKYYLLGDGTLYTLNLETRKIEKIEINFTFRKKLADEFRQMFFEAWANLNENFYNEDFHGINWQSMKEKYAAFLPHLHSRADLRILITDMLGELNSSHLGFSSNGDEEKTFYNVKTAGIGIVFDKKEPYKIVSIVVNSPADKKGKDILPGDVLKKVNGVEIDLKQDRDFYFTQPSLSEELDLVFMRGANQINVKLHPISEDDVDELLYDSWIEQNQKWVDEKSQRQIAYVYMKNMGRGELNKFLIDMNSEAFQRKALILDLRYNTGGNVHDEVLRFLSQRPYLQWKYREGELTPQSNFGPAAKPIILLVNEQSLSDAEMTATGFRELKLGKIVGTETYRWIIFTSGKQLVDGSFYRLPSWGCYTLDGKNIEKEGVKPDIEVPMTFKDRLDGRDPQLDRAIQEILKELK